MFTENSHSVVNEQCRTHDPVSLLWSSPPCIYALFEALMHSESYYTPFLTSCHYPGKYSRETKKRVLKPALVSTARKFSLLLLFLLPPKEILALLGTDDGL